MERYFEWDNTKVARNLNKHQVSFETVARVFADPWAILEQDRIEDGEYRWKALGLVDGRMVLLVAHTMREDENGVPIVRIISARRAEPKERQRYERNRAVYH